MTETYIFLLILCVFMGALAGHFMAKASGYKARYQRLELDLSTAQLLYQSVSDDLQFARREIRNLRDEQLEAPSDEELIEVYQSLGAPIPTRILNRVDQKEKVFASIMADLDNLDQGVQTGPDPEPHQSPGPCDCTECEDAW